jgi:hypothetical protein
MSIDRRAVLSLAVGLLVLTAGCSALTGDEPLEFSASSVSVSQDALDEAGFQEAEKRNVTINRSVDVQDQTRRVTITNHLAAYEKELSGDLPVESPVVAAAVSTPQATMLGVPLNPAGQMPMDRLITFASQAGAQFGGSVQSVEKVGSWETTVAGQDATVSKFSATVQKDGQSADVFIHVTRASHDGDYLLVVAAYPQAFEENDLIGQADIEPMFTGVQH